MAASVKQAKYGRSICAIHTTAKKSRYVAQPKECYATESYGLADKLIILLEQSCANLVITGIRFDRIQLPWASKLENGCGYQRLAQFFERFMLFFSWWGQLSRAIFFQQVLSGATVRAKLDTNRQYTLKKLEMTKRCDCT